MLSRPAIALPFLLLAGCADPDLEPSLGTAYVGAGAVTVRKELLPRAPVVATLQHGDRVDLLGARRRFVKIRTATGTEGWTDGYQLITPREMAEYNALRERARKVPSQGKAIIYDVLNVHVTPSRVSPSVLQLPENSTVELVGHLLMPRHQRPRQDLLPPAPKTAAKAAPARRRRGRRAPLEPLVPTPHVPRPPAAWLELSKSVAPEPAPEPPAEKPAEPPAPVTPAMEDWTLIRTADGKSGWVLFRMLNMMLPDRVLGFAAGAHITSYFPLGQIQDGENIHQHWLWTTIAQGRQPYEFDTVRVFVWNAKRHRYESGMALREVKGYYPVEVQPGGFSIVIEENGKLVRRLYSFNGYRARLAGKEAYVRPPEDVPVSMMPASNLPARAQASWTSRAKDAIRDLRRRVFGSS